MHIRPNHSWPGPEPCILMLQLCVAKYQLSPQARWSISICKWTTPSDAKSIRVIVRRPNIIIEMMMQRSWCVVQGWQHDFLCIINLPHFHWNPQVLVCWSHHVWRKAPGRILQNFWWKFLRYLSEKSNICLHMPTLSFQACLRPYYLNWPRSPLSRIDLVGWWYVVQCNWGGWWGGFGGWVNMFPAPPKSFLGPCSTSWGGNVQLMASPNNYLNTVQYNSSDRMKWRLLEHKKTRTHNETNETPEES